MCWYELSRGEVLVFIGDSRQIGNAIGAFDAYCFTVKTFGMDSFKLLEFK